MGEFGRRLTSPSAAGERKLFRYLGDRLEGLQKPSKQAFVGIQALTALVFVALCSSAMSPSAYAQDMGESIEESQQDTMEKKKSNKWKKLLGKIEEVVEEKRRKEGKISDVEIFERRGNSVTMDVLYRKVKVPEDVYLKAKVMRGGRRLRGFESTVASVERRSGRGTITVTWVDAREGMEERSDQIKIIMYRGDDDADAIKVKIFPLKKNWTVYTEFEEPGNSADIMVAAPSEPSGQDGGVYTEFEEPGSSADIMVAAPSEPSAQDGGGSETVNYTYTALTYVNVKKAGSVRTGNLTWRCGGRRCTITGPWPTPAVGACQALARQVGRISSYGHPGKGLRSSELQRCNAALN